MKPGVLKGLILIPPVCGSSPGRALSRRPANRFDGTSPQGYRLYYFRSPGNSSTLFWLAVIS